MSIIMIFKNELPLNHEPSLDHLVNSWAVDMQEADEECKPEFHTTDLDYYKDCAYDELCDELSEEGLEWA